MKDLSDFVLGETTEQLTLDSSDDNRRVAEALADQARRSLYIFSRELDKRIYDQQPFIEAVTRLATRSRNAQVHILVHHATHAVKAGHRLIDLSQRLSSFIQIRKPSEKYRDFNEAFLIADERGLIHRRLADRYEGIANFNDPLTAQPLLDFFHEVWEHSQPDTECRRLYI